MTSGGLPVLPHDGPPPLVLVAPALKVFPRVVERTVEAVTCALGVRGRVALLDLYGGVFDDAHGADVEAATFVLGEGLSGTLSSLGALVATCERLLAEQRAVVLVGPPVVPYDDRFWLYAGVARALADHVVLCTDGHLLEHGGSSFGELLLGPRSAARWSSLSVVVDADPVSQRFGTSPTRRMADMVLESSPDVRMEWPLGHLLGVFDLPPPGRRDAAVAPAVRAVLEGYLAPLGGWDWDAKELDLHPSSAARYAEFITLMTDAAGVLRRHGPSLLDVRTALDGHHALQALLRCVPAEVSRVTDPWECRALALAVLEVAEHLLAYAHARDDVPLEERHLAGAALHVGRTTTAALSAIVRASENDQALRAELATRGATLGPAMELVVLRALHQVDPD